MKKHLLLPSSGPVPLYPNPARHAATLRLPAWAGPAVE